MQGVSTWILVGGGLIRGLVILGAVLGVSLGLRRRPPEPRTRLSSRPSVSTSCSCPYSVARRSWHDSADPKHEEYGITRPPALPPHDAHGLPSALTAIRALHIVGLPHDSRSPLEDALKAAVLQEIDRPLEIMDLRQDPPKAQEVRVKMEAAGLCASDYHVMKGTAIQPVPIVLGHEGAGIVTEVGEGVTRVKPGDRCILSFVSNCGHCHQCRTGNPQLCDTNMKTGPLQYDGTARLHDGDTDIGQMSKLGVFSESLVAPQQACHPIPDGVPMHVAAPHRLLRHHGRRLGD